MSELHCNALLCLCSSFLWCQPLPTHPLCVWLVYDCSTTRQMIFLCNICLKIIFYALLDLYSILKIRIVFPVILFLIKFAQKMRFFLSIENALVWHWLACLQWRSLRSDDSYSNEWINVFDWYSYIILTAGALNSGTSDLNNSWIVDIKIFNNFISSCVPKHRQWLTLERHPNSLTLNRP